GLDPKVTIEMYELISSINKGNKDENKEPITIIMVSHDVQAALNYATKILHVSDTPEFFESKEAYLNSKIGKQFTNV
ncbi:MAG: ABC transporter, partial [Lachnospiraceae bacterium]|nr:ABC transporter [Lachnospiraceae bacterium]